MFFNKKKSTQDQFLELFGNALKEAANRSREIGPILHKQQRPHQPDFGRSETNPILISSLEGTEQYLRRLCTKEGKKFTWSSYTGIRTNIGELTDIGEDMYTLYLEGQPYTKLYFVPYCAETKFPPAGLYFSDDSTDWDLEREAFSKGMTVYQLKEQRRKEKEETELIAKASVIKQKYPSCNLAADVKNPLFVFLAKLDYDLIQAYEYIHKDKLFHKKEKTTQMADTIYSSQYFYDLLCKSETKRHVVDCSTMSRLELQTAAAKEGVSIYDYVGMNKLERENAEILWNARLRQFKKYSEQAVEAASIFPQFDLIADMRNKIFDKIADRFGVVTAHEICHFNDYYIPVEGKDEPLITSVEEPVKVAHSEEILFCRKCGTKLFSDSVFCHKCGFNVSVP